ncbi:MAG: amino acid permease [Verrucomicrobiales bacterium]|jgi:aromatic amino acid transport protein AroP|nr:amino acid permease [Verrucomicrobiales bacterium]
MQPHTPPNGHLHRALRNRHVQLIALGGAIGTGLFLGSAGVMALTGPSLLLGYALGGLVAFLIMRQLGEMIAEEPVAGSFSHFAHKYWGDFPGFLAGWNYWALYVLVGMAELTAVAKYIHFWWPWVPQWLPALVCFIFINALNLANVRIFGETEFWFALIKVAAVIGMMVLGGWLIVSGAAPAAAVDNLWTHGGFFAGGARGFALSLVVIMFSFGGLELIGIAAAETADPARTIPLAINQVLWRILIFYLGALGVMLILTPWNVMVSAINAGGDDYGGSPFVLIFSQLGIDHAAHLLNFVILTAALSVYNSGVYCNSRMLYGLAAQGHAPRWLAETNRRGVPVAAIGVSALATFLCVAVNFVFPKQALMLMLMLVVAALLINWALISLTSLKFRAHCQRAGRRPKFRAVAYPAGHWFCLVFILFILVAMCYIKDFQHVVWVVPGWLAFMGLCYGKFRANRRRG